MAAKTSAATERALALVHSRPDVFRTFWDAVERTLSPPKAMAEGLENPLGVTRKEFFYAAVRVGISIRAAKSYYDRNNK